MRDDHYTEQQPRRHEELLGRPRIDSLRISGFTLQESEDGSAGEAIINQQPYR